jgi:uracil DNA glycosylase
MVVSMKEQKNMTVNEMIYSTEQDSAFLGFQTTMFSKTLKASLKKFVILVAPHPRPLSTAVERGAERSEAG